MTTPEQRLLATPVELREATSPEHPEAIPMQGYAARFHQRANIGGLFWEEIQPGAFAPALAANPDVRLLLNHDANYLLARSAAGTLRLAEDALGLRVEADMAPTSYAQDLRVLLERGDIGQMSFAFVVAPDGEQWQELPDGSLLRTITAIAELWDVSVVTYPAYDATQASLRSEDLERIKAELAASRRRYPVATNAVLRRYLRKVTRSKRG